VYMYFYFWRINDDDDDDDDDDDEVVGLGARKTRLDFSHDLDQEALLEITYG